MQDRLTENGMPSRSDADKPAVPPAISDTRRLNQSSVQPVSRVWFELSDTGAFDKCIEQAVQWMAQYPRNSTQPRSGVMLPASAWQGQSFDITDDLGANPAKATRLDASDGSLWAARLDWPDPSYPRSWVSEFFVEKRARQMVRFGAQLTCVRRGECPPFGTTRPTVIQRILETLSAEADGRPLADMIDPLGVAEVPELIDLLYNESRRLPVVVLSEGDDGRTEVPANSMARRIAGAAHIVHLTREAAWELTRRLGKRMSVFNGAVRLYQPGLTDNSEDPFAHPLWLRQAQADDVLLHQLANRVLPAAFLDRFHPIFPRYAAVRDVVGRLTRQTEPDEGSAWGTNELELVQTQVAEVTEERDEWQSLALKEQDKRLSVERDVERYKAEIKNLDDKIRGLEYKAKILEYSVGQKQNAQASQAPPRSLLSYADLEDWAEEVLGDAVYIHQAALKDCRKNGHDTMLRRIEAALLVMKDHMTVARRTGDATHREQARIKFAELGFEDTPCFSDRDEAKRWPQYCVPYEDGYRILYDHLKYGNSYNNSTQIRIYYFWDDVKNRYVVGKMPTHLQNNLSN